MACRYFFCAKAHGVVQKCLELDLRVTQDVRVGRAPRLVFGQKLGKHTIFVFSSKVDVLDFDAQHICNSCRVHKIDVGGAVPRVVCANVRRAVVILPVLHEDADDLVPLLF